MTQLAKNNFPPRSPESRSRQWTLHVVALLMVAQAVGLTVFTVYYVSQVNWIRERPLFGLSSVAVDTILFSVLSIPLALFGGRAVLGLLRRRRGAWLQAMIMQALLLVFALASYVMQEANNLTYWTLVSCIIVVMYLNTHEVRASFHADALDDDDPTDFFEDFEADEFEPNDIEPNDAAEKETSPGKSTNADPLSPPVNSPGNETS